MSPSHLALIVPFAALMALGGASAQAPQAFETVDETRRALSEAVQQGEAAKARAEALEANAAAAREAADRTAQEAAALAARVQQAESAIAANEARVRLIAGQQQVLRSRLAERQRPVVQLTAALQRLARQPPALALLRPGSLTDTIHLRAVLEGLLPEVERRTAALRQEIARARTLQRQAEAVTANLRGSERDLVARRQALAALETRQRLELRQTSGVADREAERALAYAEEARDLSTLVERLGEAAAIGETLARLPGPVLRPDQPATAEVADLPAPAQTAAGLGQYLLPVAGRLVAGFGDAAGEGGRSRGLSLAARPNAQVIAPAAGRVVFAGTYRGYGNIVIIDHGGGWTTLVTGLAQLDIAVGQRLVGGSPLGSTGPGRPLVTVELRQGGVAVNPLEAIRPA